jgi:peroxiredoxin
MKHVIYMIRIVLLVSAVIILVHYPGSIYADTAKNSEKAPDFELADMQGSKHRLSDLHGKVVLINFWASWCRECLGEMPSLNSLYEKFKNKDVVVLGVSTDSNNEDIKKSIGKTHVTYPVLIDGNGEVFERKYAVRGLPTTVIVDKNGYIAGRLLGSIDFSSAAFMNKIKMMSEEKSR